MKTLTLIAILFITTEALATQVIDTTATVVCGKSEQPTPCILVLNRSVPSYILAIKKENHELLNFKVDRVEGAWQVLGEKRKENLSSRHTPRLIFLSALYFPGLA